MVSPTLIPWSLAHASSTTVSRGPRELSVAGEPCFHSTLKARGPLRGSRPVTDALPFTPVTLLAENISGVATATPGTFARAASVDAGTPLKLSVFWTTNCAWISSSIASPTEPLIPAAKIATKVTSARPIIRAAAVDAVRPGLRRAFSRASRPVTPRRRSSGQPTTEARGRTSLADSMATPMKIATAPAPRRAATALPPPASANSP